MLLRKQLPFVAANACLNRVYTKSNLWRLPNRKLDLPGPLIRYSSKTMATGPARPDPLIGLSGRNYNIERVLQEETDPPRQVYVAT